MDKIKSKKRWRAKKGDEYYFIDLLNRIITTHDTRSELDKSLYKVGNYFATWEEATEVRMEFKSILDKHINEN